MEPIDDVLIVVTWIFLEVLPWSNLLDITTSTQAIKLKFGHNEFGERFLCNLQTRIRGQVDQLREQVDKVIDYFIYQRVFSMY